MLIKIASRKSDLARLQAYTVAHELKSIESSLQVEHLFSSSFGDLNPDISLNNMPEKGAFTEDFKEGIQNRQFDIVVHSWKDLPTDLSSESVIYTIKRADPRDLILIRKESISSVKNSKKINVLTSSPRRVHHISSFIDDFFPIEISEVNCLEVRGNIPTRLEKLIKGEGDALIIAKAAIDRLLEAKQEEFHELQSTMRKMLSQCNFMVLPLTTFPTAAAQGALAIEVHKDNSQVISYLKKIHCEQTFAHVKKERKLLKSFGGGCHQKLGMTSIPHQLGSFFSASGLSSINNETIKILDFIKEYKTAAPNKTESAKSFPHKEHKKSFFKREKISAEIPVNHDIYISKDYALPDNFELNDHGEKDGIVLWVSGLSSWKKLAKKGYWIHGSSESLGENVGINIETLINRNANWVKLTHDKATLSYHKKVLSTYTLKDNDIEQISGQEENFYWMSASQFKAAIKKYPHIIDKNHCCGAGSSFNEIAKHISKDQLRIYLGYDQWYKSTVK